MIIVWGARQDGYGLRGAFRTGAPHLGLRPDQAKTEARECAHRAYRASLARQAFPLCRNRNLSARTFGIRVDAQSSSATAVISVLLAWPGHAGVAHLPSSNLTADKLLRHPKYMPFLTGRLTCCEIDQALKKNMSGDFSNAFSPP
ncbi:hypothetical protein AB4Y45_36730 [Paraburkholderia sp. EG287A]|uniref:hypothetical protein n=1 Tax=unclassified Paraburkholderia TaxID=2615204 RepID=UPI0034D1ABB7